MAAGSFDERGRGEAPLISLPFYWGQVSGNAMSVWVKTTTEVLFAIKTAHRDEIRASHEPGLCNIECV